MIAPILPLITEGQNTFIEQLERRLRDLEERMNQLETLFLEQDMKINELCEKVGVETEAPEAV